MLMCSPFMCPTIDNNGKSLSISAHNTQNALYHYLEGVYGVPIIIDDILTNEKLNISEVIYTIAQGSPKGRLNGNCELRESLGWSGVVAISSETPILDTVSGLQGLKARVLHTYGIQWTKSAEEATLVKRVVSRNYGFTGKEFAEYVSKIPIDELYDRFTDSLDIVKELMVKKDRLTERLAYKYAAVHLTVLLVNKALNFNISAQDITKLFIKCEQDCFDERDNSSKAFKAILDFVDRHESNFIWETHYSQTYANTESACKPRDSYGKIIKYDTHWEVHLLDSITKSVLDGCGLGCEIRNIRKEWVKRGLALGSAQHNTKQFMHDGTIKRHDCFIIKGGIKEPSVEWVEKTLDESQQIPISNYTVDDDAQIDEIFGDDNDNTL